MNRPALRVIAVAAGFACVSVIVAGTAAGMMGSSSRSPVAAAVELQQEDPASQTAAVAAPGAAAQHLSAVPAPIEVGYPALECDSEGNCDADHTVAVNRTEAADSNGTQSATSARPQETDHERFQPRHGARSEAGRPPHPQQPRGEQPRTWRDERSGTEWPKPWRGNGPGDARPDVGQQHSRGESHPPHNTQRRHDERQESRGREHPQQRDEAVHGPAHQFGEAPAHREPARDPAPEQRAGNHERGNSKSSQADNHRPDHSWHDKRHRGPHVR